MYLTRRDPSMTLPTFQGLQREVNRMFDEAFGGLANGGTRSWGPPVEIYESESELVIIAEVPGFEKKEINISLENGQLSLSGERKIESEQKGRNYHRNERWYGRFERSFQLPAVYDAEKIKAQLKDGLLTVTLPKRAEARTRQIPVSIG